jgi:TonB family protein
LHKEDKTFCPKEESSPPRHFCDCRGGFWFIANLAHCRRPAREATSAKKNTQSYVSLFTLVTAMARNALICLLALFLVRAAHADSLKDALNHKYKNQILALRSPLTAGDQKFDSAGHSIDTPPNSGWLLYGGIYVEKLNLSSDTLRLEGPRAAFSDEKKNGKPVLVRFSKSQQIEIHLDKPLDSLNDADAVIGRVFLPGADAAEHAKPEFRRADDNTPDDQIYHVGNGTSLPRPTYTPEPEFSEEARHARFQGVVVMKVVVSKTGNIVRIKLEKVLGKGLDENAMEKLKSWRFEPATRKGQPVAVEMNIEVAFHLYSRPRTTH